MPLDRALTPGRLVLSLVALAGGLAGPLPAIAGGTPGDFDFYVLALTWSPSYCRNNDRADPDQCDHKPPGFVVHGLWPQYERGYPEYCGSSQPRRLQRSVHAANADIMPSWRAANYQWAKHGICSGHRPERYFDLMRRAVATVVVPRPLADPDKDLSTSPRAVEAAFREANPGLSERGMSVSCNRQGVIEVRVCLTKRLSFRRCPEVDARGCRRPTISLPDNR